MMIGNILDLGGCGAVLCILLKELKWGIKKQPYSVKLTQFKTTAKKHHSAAFYTFLSFIYRVDVFRGFKQERRSHSIDKGQ